MKMELKSYEKFAAYEEKMSKQLNNLKNQLTLKQDELASLQQEYVAQFAQGEEPVKVIGKINNIKSVIAMLKDEIELIEASDLKEKQLSRAVYEEFRELLHDIGVEQNRIWEQAVKVIETAYAEVDRLSVDYEALYEKGGVVCREQFLPVVDHLDMSDDTKDSLRRKTWIIPGTPLKRVKELVH